MFESHFSLYINTPESLAQFQNGRNTDDQIKVSIHSGAHPDILSLPKYFAHYTNSNEITFMDLADRMSFVSIYPGEKKVQAHFANGKDVALGLPNDYETYEIRYSRHGGVETTKTDLDYVLTWENVKVLSFKDSPKDDVANILAQRIDEMKSKAVIEELYLMIQSNTYDDWNVGTFLEQLPNVKLVRLSMARLTDDQKVGFLERQRISKGWTFKFDRRTEDVTYQKQGSGWRSIFKRVSNNVLDEMQDVFSPQV